APAHVREQDPRHRLVPRGRARRRTQELRGDRPSHQRGSGTLTIQAAISALETLYGKAHGHLKAKLSDAKGRISNDLLNENQLGAHALAYLATELEACRQVAGWAERVGGEFEGKIARAYVGEVARSLRGGVDLGPCESIPLSEMGLTE